MYSIQYDDAEENEFDRLFQKWNDVEYVVNFLNENKDMLLHPIWLNITEPEEAAKQVLKDPTLSQSLRP